MKEEGAQSIMDNINSSSRAFNRVLTGLAGAVLCVAALSAEAFGQESILEKIPSGDVAYVWADDFQDLVRRSETLFSIEPEAWRQAWQVGGEGDPDKSERIKLLNLDSLERMALLLEVWEQLRDGEIFDGQFLLVMPTNDDGILTAPDLLESAVIKSGPIILAETSADEDEIKEFFKKVRRLSQSTEDEDADESEEGSWWQIKNGWFCGSANEAATTRLLQYASGEVAVKKSLADDRTYQTAVRSLKADYSGESFFSFYLPGKTLPTFFEATLGNDASIIMADVDSDDWTGLYLNELRGLAGRIYVGDESIDESLTAPLIVDAYLLSTQPRSGILRTIPQDTKVGLDFDAPFLGWELSRFSQFAIDGNGLATGVLESMKRDAALSGEELPEGIEVETDSELELWRRLTHFVELSYHFPEEPSGSYEFERFGILAKVDDRDLFIEFFETFDEEMEAVPVSQLSAPYNMIGHDDALGWVTAASVIQERIATAQARILEMTEQVEVLKDDRSDEAKRQVEELNARINSEQARMEIYEDGPGDPQLLQFGDWLTVAEFDDLETTRQQGLINAGAVHPQIKHLEESIADLKGYLRIDRNQCAVLAVWPYRLINDLHSASEPKTFNADGPVEVEESSRDIQFSRIQKIAAYQFQEFFLIGTNYDSGIRISGALVRAELEDEVRDALGLGDEGKEKN